MTTKADNTLNDVTKVFTYSGLAISALGILFYPAEEIADATEAELGIIPTISKVLSGLGLIGTLYSVGLLYNEHVKLPLLVKWIFVPLLILDVLLVVLLLSLNAFGPEKLSVAGKFVLKYVKPAICSLGAVGMIIGMAVLPKQLLKVSYAGDVVHYLPAALNYPPINKHPFYVIVVAVRTGGLITSTAAGFIEVATEGQEE
ncbi:MAG: hypothetical protein AAFO03_15920 [Bacteroidota bacterium]